MSPIQLVDPKYNVKLRIRAYGQFGMKIDDYRVVLTELIGTLKPQDIVNYSKILEYFKGILIMKANSLIAQAIIKNKVSALEISASIDEISQHCQKEIVKEFNRFGFKVINFYIQSINFPDEDFNDINLILKDKATFDIIGDKKYVTKRSFDTLDSAAKNESVSGAFAGAGLGVGLGAGLNNVITKLNDNINTLSDNKKCINCGTENIYLLSSEQAAKHKIKKSLKAKNKIIAGLLAIFLGTFGIHKFYLQNKSQGVLYLVFFWTGIPTILGLIEGIRYLVMKDNLFYTSY